MLNNLECCLCSQIEGQQANDLIARLLPDEVYVRRVMLESPSFAVIPSLGPLTNGHSLLCPKQHIKSFAHIASDVHEEYEEVKKRLKMTLIAMYKTGICLFEHGMATNGNRILCTVDHAHMHFVPLPRTFDGGAVEEEGWTEFDGSLSTLMQLSRGREYILYETPAGSSRLLIAREGELESQYMRRVLAKGLGHGNDWNWRDAPGAPAADETWRRFVRFTHDPCVS
jgi:diadenosine tetraphosphate (Ap4A) HIT family hydrolase